jgi:hypothetical protein
MKHIKEDGGTASHRIISTEKLLNTHSRAIKELLQQISSSYNISLDDAAFAVANALTRFTA